MDIDPLILSRIQFAFTISFHIIFPSFTIGLAAWIATLEGMWLWSKNERYHTLARFWTKIFAVSFGMGVVSGIVMSYQFGTNWSEYSRVVGNVVAPLIGYEVLTSFGAIVVGIGFSIEPSSGMLWLMRGVAVVVIHGRYAEHGCDAVPLGVAHARPEPVSVLTVSEHPHA